MHDKKQTRRPLPLWLFGLFFLLITALTIAAMVRYWHFRQQVKETVAELRRTVASLRGDAGGLDDEAIDAFERKIDALDADHKPKLAKPVPLLAYISPAPDVFPDDPPILTLIWLEAAQVTDGVVLETAGETEEDEPQEIARVTGWANALSDEEMQKVFEGRFDRFAFVDVLIDGDAAPDHARDMVRITWKQLAPKLTARLLYDSKATDAVPVHVGSELWPPGGADRSVIGP
jgi:hypothetical protein